MSFASREQVMITLFNLLSGAYAFQTTSRRPMTQASLPNTLMPALFLLDDDEDHKRGDKITPAIRTIKAGIWIFTNSGQNPDPTITPVTILNNIIDSIDPVCGGVLKPGPNGLQTLGGIVVDCWIEGKITKDPGMLTSGEYAHIPLMIRL